MGIFSKIGETMLEKNQTDWTTEQLINMSQSLAQAYCPGLVQRTLTPSSEQDSWNTQKLAELGKSLSNGFGYGF